jgi:ubiquitin carboxyl-terminal hydrolase 34
MASDGADTGMRVSVELESDALLTNPAIETPSSSPSAPGSPEIEVLTIHEDDEEFTTRSPPLAIIDEDELFVDPFLHFPYNNDGESLVATVRRLVHFIQYGMFSAFKLLLKPTDSRRTS